MAGRAYGGIEFALTGQNELRRHILALALDNRADEAGKAIESVMQQEFSASQEMVPVGKTGRLKRSGRVIPTVMTGEGKTIDFVSRIVYGLGPDNVLYAIAQHEKLMYRHEDGQARYLGDVMRESAKFMSHRIGLKLRALLIRG